MIPFHPRCIGTFGAVVVGAVAGMPAMVVTSAAAPDTLACEGAFAKDTTHAKLVEAFGRSNVAVLEIDGDQGVKVKASVVYPDESRRRIYVVWHDEKLRRRPATIRVDFRSGWHTVRGLHVGTELGEVEKVNGKTFRLTGFDWEFGGRVSNWQGGALAKRLRAPLRLQSVGGCARPRSRQGERRKGISLQRPHMRASKPTVSEIIISYPE